MSVDPSEPVSPLPSNLATELLPEASKNEAALAAIEKDTRVTYNQLLRMLLNCNNQRLTQLRKMSQSALHDLGESAALVVEIGEEKIKVRALSLRKAINALRKLAGYV